MKKIYIIDKLNYFIFFKLLFLNLINFNKKIEILYFDSLINIESLNFLFPFFLKKIKKFEFDFTNLIYKDDLHPYIKWALKDYHIFFDNIIHSLNLNRINNNEEFDFFKIFLKNRIFEENKFNNHLIAIKISAINYFLRLKNDKATIIFYIFNSFINKQFVYYANQFNIKIYFYYNSYNLYLKIKSYIKSTPLYLLFKFLEFNKYKKIKNKNFNDNSFPITIDSALEILSETKFWSDKIINSKNAFYVSRYYDDIINKKLSNNYNPGLNYYCIDTNFSENLLYYYKFNTKYPNNIFFFESEYELEKLNWKKFFKKFNTKIYITNHRWEPKSVTACSAINELQGISIYYQTSYYEIPDGCSNNKTDIYFSFSNQVNKYERETGSKISYNISCGYVRDFIYDNVKIKSKKIRNQLINKGCKKIISIFDQEYSKDKRWFYSKEYYLNNENIYIWFEWNVRKLHENFFIEKI